MLATSQEGDTNYILQAWRNLLIALEENTIAIFQSSLLYKHSPKIQSRKKKKRKGKKVVSAYALKM